MQDDLKMILVPVVVLAALVMTGLAYESYKATLRQECMAECVRYHIPSDCALSCEQR